MYPSASDSSLYRVSAFEAFRRALDAVMHSEMKSKYGRRGMGLLFRVVEPLFHIGVLVLWHWAVRVMPVYGTSKILFISTGIYPIFIFVHLSDQFRNIIGKKRSFPGILPIDIALVRALVILFTYLLFGVGLFTGIYYLVSPGGLPCRPERVLMAIACVSLAGFGVGLMNAILEEVIPIWHFVWGGVSRASIIFSGVLYVPDYLPTFLRNILQWNPILQAVELFRQGFYYEYPQVIFKPLYLSLIVVACLVLGLCIERFIRPYASRLRLFHL